MGGTEAVRVLAAKFAAIFPHLDERQRRLRLWYTPTIIPRSILRVRGSDSRLLSNIRG
jgi:hypothetical protein